MQVEHLTALSLCLLALVLLRVYRIILLDASVQFNHFLITLHLNFSPIPPQILYYILLMKMKQQ
jgi:hypothetical protein